MAAEPAPVPLVLRKRGKSATRLDDDGANCLLCLQMGLSFIYIFGCMIAPDLFMLLRRDQNFDRRKVCYVSPRVYSALPY